MASSGVNFTFTVFSVYSEVHVESTEKYVSISKPSRFMLLGKESGVHCEIMWNLRTAWDRGTKLTAGECWFQTSGRYCNGKASQAEGKYKLRLRSSGLLHSVYWWLFTDVSD